MLRQVLLWTVLVLGVIALRIAYVPSARPLLDRIAVERARLMPEDASDEAARLVRLENPGAVTGLSLNVYSQIGLVMLIGIMAKNGILIVEFANQLRDGGAGVAQAALDAATIRLGPVMMTMASTVLGGVPLILSSGAGAEAREALGWVIVGGLGLATLSTLYLTPVAYLLLARFSKPRAEESKRLARELEEALAG